MLRPDVIRQLANDALDGMKPGSGDATSAEIISAGLTLAEWLIKVALETKDAENKEHNRRVIQDVLYRLLAQTADTDRKPS